MTCIAVVGLGYVGLPLAVAFAEAGVNVVGIDVDAHKVDLLREGQSYIGDVERERVTAAVAQQRFFPTTNFGHIGRVEAIFICVPTPYDAQKRPDLGCIQAAARSVGRHLKPGHLVILQSTSWPGTTSDVLTQELEAASGLSWWDHDFSVAFVPERVDPGSRFPLTRIPKVVGGDAMDTNDRVVGLLEHLSCPIHVVSSPEAAEMVKLLENSFRAVNIALVNQFALLCEEMELDVWEIIDAASTKPYGFMPFYPGPGVGGHCIPIDPYYLLAKAQEYSTHLPLIENAMATNEAMPRHVRDLLYCSMYDHNLGRGDRDVLILGSTYKPNVADTRESPSLVLFGMLQGDGVWVRLWDPLVDVTPLYLDLEECDTVVIMVAHDNVDYQEVIDSVRLVVDCCNATAGCIPRNRVVRLGSGR